MKATPEKERVCGDLNEGLDGGYSSELKEAFSSIRQAVVGEQFTWSGGRWARAGLFPLSRSLDVEGLSIFDLRSLANPLLELVSLLRSFFEESN